MNSQLFKINWTDTIGGLISAVVIAVFTLAIQMLSNVQTIDLKQLGITAAIAGMGYILTRLGHDENNNPLGIK